MTKHDFHIALVLLAMITAGTLGYQSLNAESTYVPDKCTLVLYFSSFDGCNSSDTIDILPQPFLKERLHSKAKPEEIGLFEIENNMPDDTLFRRAEWSDEIPESTLNFEPDTMQQVDSISFLFSDAHGEFIKQVNCSTVQTVKM